MVIELRRDQIAKNYSQEEWNQLYQNASEEADELTKLWNMLYNQPSNAAVLLYNKMYEAVANGKKLTDPDLAAEIAAWNASAGKWERA